MAKEILLNIDYTIEGINCISYSVVSLKRWNIVHKKLQDLLKKKDNRTIIQAYGSNPPNELYGEEFYAAKLCSNLYAITAPAKINAFKLLFDDHLYSMDNFIEKILSAVERLIMEDQRPKKIDKQPTITIIRKSITNKKEQEDQEEQEDQDDLTNLDKLDDQDNFLKRMLIF